MGVRGLTTYLQRDSRNFIKYELHNTTVIIDALNFLNFIYFDSGIYTQFNGEYLAFSGVINRYISSLRRCLINPIFVFDGCHEYFKLTTQLKRNYQRMQTCREFLKHIKSHNLSPTDSSYYITLLPPLATVTLVQALDELKVDYVTTDGESDQDIISLGIYLQCPVISDDSDFYVTMPTTTAGICFLPLSFISFKPIINSINCNICQTHNKICAYLKCQKFLPNGPGFKYLPDVQRPLFASLLGNDYVSPCVFLKALPISQGKIINLNHNASKEMKIKRKSSIIVNLINWLSSFGVNTEEPIKRILDKYPKSERYKLSIELSQSLQSYKTDPELLYSTFAKHLQSLNSNKDSNLVSSRSSSNISIGSSAPNPSVLPQLSTSTTSSCPSEFDEDISTVDHYGDDVNELCDKYILATDMSINSFKVTSYWPEELLNSFRKYLILPIFVDSILSHGLVSVCGVEALHDCHSIYSNSLYLRSLIYNLILGIECNVTFRFPNHLIGIEKSKSSSSYYITEFDRKGSFHIKRRKVFVHPMNLLENNEMNGKDHRLVFLQQYLGLEYDTLESDNNWLTSIVLINVLTYKSKCIPCTNDDITQCPISLTFGAICICAYLLIRHYNYSDLSYCKPLKKHFYNCAKYFTTQLNSTIQKSHLIKQNNTIQHHHTLKIHIVHVYAQLQIYYITISTLIHLLNSIVTNKDRNNLSTCLNVLPICSIFPSGYLFHEICYCTHLIQSENNERQQYVRNVIIEKLMDYQNTNKNHLNDALNLFNCYLTLSSIQLCKSSFIKCSTNVKLVESNFSDKSKQSHDNNNNNDKSSMENEMKQDEGSNMLPTKKIENITQTKKKVEKKRKQRKQHIKQPSYAEIEEKIAKLMLENDLFD